MTESIFLEGFTSIERAIAEADGFDAKLNAFGTMSSEVPEWVRKGGIEKCDAVDRLREIGLAEGFSEDAIQSAIVEAFSADAEKAANVEAIRSYIAEANPNFANSGSSELVVHCAADIKPEPIRWLWPHRIAIGKLTILAGEPGLGKSQLSGWIAAAVTTGGAWPNQEGYAPEGSAIILSAEDDAADTIIPRLIAAGADVTKVHIVSSVRTDAGKGRRGFNIQADLKLLEKEIDRIGDVRLVVIDPISSYLGKVDSHKNAELRQVLEPIGEMAARLGVSALAVTHLSKSGGGSANNRVIGSIAFVAAARAAFIVFRDPDDPERRLFLPTKNNLGPDRSGLAFRIGAVVTQSDIIAPTVFWESGPVTITADEVLGTSTVSKESAPARSEAEEFLREQLNAGPVLVKQLESEAKAAGLSWPTVKRAKAKLGAKATKTGLDGGWVWTLPEGDQDDDPLNQDAHVS